MIDRTVALILMEMVSAKISAQNHYTWKDENRYRADMAYANDLRCEAIDLLREDGVDEISPEMLTQAETAWLAYAALNARCHWDGNKMAKAKSIIAKIGEKEAERGDPRLKYGDKCEPWMFFKTATMRFAAYCKHDDTREREEAKALLTPKTEH